MTQRIDDGHATLFTFGNNPSVKFFEKTVTPPGVEGGGENDTTTMRNTNWRTRAPKKLKTLTNSSTTVSYDPAIYDEVVSLIQVNQQITITFPDASTVTFWGWLDSFAPGENTEGEQPTAEITVIPSNQDNTGAEVGPAYADNAPAAPANLAVTNGVGTVTLDWDTVVGADAYSVYRTTVSGEGYSLVAQNLVSNTFVDTTVTGGTDYYYIVRTITAGVLSDATAEVLGEPT